jgi:hypothetical protein
MIIQELRSSTLNSLLICPTWESRSRQSIPLSIRWQCLYSTITVQLKTLACTKITLARLSSVTLMSLAALKGRALSIQTRIFRLIAH